MGKTFKDSPLFKETVRRGSFGVKHTFTKRIQEDKVKIVFHNPQPQQLASARAQLVEGI
ncbi:MAG: hypothetical protein P4N60_19315 [Verrucomicrobiae bacterium]|nr:hypothetical protein [Verrucomicrobiae bacterium]